MQAVALAVAAVLGARAPTAAALWPGVALAAWALGARRGWLACGAVALCASGLSARAWDGLAPPEPAATQGVATLVSDPEAVPGGVRVDVSLEGHRYRAVARGRPAWRLDGLLAGERAELSGTLEPLTPTDRARLAPRHLSGRLTVAEVSSTGPGSPVARAANRVRRTLERGASPLPPALRALFTGFVLGDDRAQSDADVEAFRAAGLSHLLAVSGQNVAFVLVVVGPVLRRLPLGARWALTAAVLAWFALLTRFEPSVLRACVMAFGATTASTAGRPASPVRLLALAVAALVLVDPLLAWSTGFGLSVGATAGIAVLAARIERALPGPRRLAAALSVTLAAQAGVAPVAIGAFGGLPLVAVATNLVAAPLAGPVMVWGLTAGMVAGLVPAVAPVVHLPVRLALSWVRAVAYAGAANPVAIVGAPGLVMVVTGAAVVTVARSRRRRDGR